MLVDMNAETIDEAWGRARAIELLEQTAAQAEADADKGRFHTILISMFGQIATVGNVPEIRTRALHLLNRAPDEEYVAGLITNISDVSRFVQREIPEADAARYWPKYERSRVLAYARRCGPVERLTLEGRFAEAEAAANDDFAMECYVATRALMGDFDQALAIMNSPSYPKTRKFGPFAVVCIESYRAGNHGLSGALLNRRLSTDPTGPWLWSNLATGYLGLVPWGGYPYADY